MLIKKIPDTSGLVATTNMNTKMIEVENKIPNTSNLVNQKISEVEKKISGHAKYTTTQECNQLTAEHFTAN